MKDVCVLGYTATDRDYLSIHRQSSATSGSILLCTLKLFGSFFDIPLSSVTLEARNDLLLKTEIVVIKQPGLNLDLGIKIVL
jgi:hypothetical protein